MKKQVYEIDVNGYLKEIHLAEFDGNGNLLEELAANIITIDPPQGLYRARWAGTEWVEDMPQAEILDSIKQAKIVELDIACTADIESGFTSSADGVVPATTIWGMDLKTDQPNLNQQASDIGLGTATEPISWKPKGDVLPVNLTIAQFKALWNDGKATKWAKIGKFRNLSDAVKAAITIDAVKAIVW